MPMTAHQAQPHAAALERTMATGGDGRRRPARCELLWKALKPARALTGRDSASSTRVATRSRARAAGVYEELGREGRGARQRGVEARPLPLLAAPRDLRRYGLHAKRATAWYVHACRGTGSWRSGERSRGGRTGHWSARDGGINTGEDRGGAAVRGPAARNFKAMIEMRFWVAPTTPPLPSFWRSTGTRRRRLRASPTLGRGCGTSARSARRCWRCCKTRMMSAASCH